MLERFTVFPVGLIATHDGPWVRFTDAQERIDQLEAERDAQQSAKDAAYLERNKLVLLLASIFPSGIKHTDIEGWSPDWHGCVYIDFPWGQASWHYHNSHSHLFSHLPPYSNEWDGHTTESKYEMIVEASIRHPISAVDGYLLTACATAEAKGYAAGIEAVLALQKYVVDNLEGDTEKTGWVLASDIRALLQPTSGPETGDRGEFGQPEDGAPAGGGAVEKGVAEIDTLGAAPAGGWGGKKDG